jgi:hypothetical protein
MLLPIKAYLSSYTKVRGIIKELEKLNIKDIPGENITTLVQKASNQRSPNELPKTGPNPGPTCQYVESL